MKKKLLISFSGGRTSAFMAKWCLENLRNEFTMEVVFANTGKEREETLEFVDKCNKCFDFGCTWVEAIHNPIHGKGVRAKEVNFINASRNGEPFEELIKKHGIPNVANASCTRNLKRYAIHSFAKELGMKEYFTAIGIRIDEIDRISTEANKERYIYPLVSAIPTNKNNINRFWRDQSFDLRLKTYEGNCDLCFKKSKRKLLTLAIEKPDLFLWWKEMELKYGNFIPESRKSKDVILPINFFRNNKTTDYFLNESKNEFQLAVDESEFKPYYEQLSMFDDMDTSNGCSESCEVF